MTVLNYLEIDKDYTDELRRLEKQAMQKNNIRR